MLSVQAHIKRQPEDWRVVEHLDSALLERIEAGVGEHLYLFLRKRGLNTTDVAVMLADHFRLPRIAIGYAGRKDKHAVTDQWFSVHTPAPLDPDEFEVAGVTLVGSGRSVKKLRIGELRANEFQIRLRDVTELAGQVRCLHESLEKPFANLFGPQRMQNNNVEDAIEWVLNRRQRQVSRQQRGWHLSVLRSFLFNKIVEARLRCTDLCQPVVGDFCVDGVPTVPLWGRGRSQTTGEALGMERGALGEFAPVCEALEYAGVNQARRKLYSQPQALKMTTCDAPNSIDLGFWLPPGTYATSMLSNSLTLIDDTR